MKSPALFQAALAIGLLASALGAEERARTYTNDDLARVAPHSAETGVASVPAFTEYGPPPARSVQSNAASAEARWRREARRVRERATALRQQIEDLPRPASLSPGASRAAVEAADRRRQAAAARRATLERRIRALEDDLADRARREGALPGWLR